MAIKSLCLILYNAVMSKFGTHFVIYGPTGSGKSTLARQISRQTGLPHIELDAIYWLPGWQGKPLEQYRSDISAKLSQCPQGWICDGNYSQVRDLILPLADTVIWLRPPYPVALWRLVKRTFARSRNREMLWGTNSESLRKTFFSRDSLLLFQITHWAKYNKIGQNINKYQHHATVIQLHSTKEIETFIRELS